MKKYYRKCPFCKKIGQYSWKKGQDKEFDKIAKCLDCFRKYGYIVCSTEKPS